MPQVDKIFTQYGDFIVDYSAFNHLFFVGKYPECFNEKPEIKIRSHRDCGFKTYDELQQHVREVVKEFEIEYKFIRKVISYRMGVESYLYFDYFIANESGGTKFKDHKDGEYLLEYVVLESSIERYVGQRNIIGQITGDTKNWVVIDYDENVHKFMVDFIGNLEALKTRLKEFFNKENVLLNIAEVIKNRQQLLSV